MRFNKFSFIILFAVCFCNVIFAQSSEIASSYFCDFEDAEENEKWMLNVGVFGPKCANKWYIGKPGAANGGEAGLFVSCDSAVTSNYTNKAVTVIAYRELTLAAGDYELSFDWKAGGTEYNDGLYVCLVPTSDTDVRFASTTSSVLDNWAKNTRPDGYALDFGRDYVCLNQRYWNSVVDSINIRSNDTYKLVFIWCNGLLTPYSLGACIDNIMIMPKGLCNRPTDFRVNTKGNDLLLSWMGDTDAYDVQIYDYETDTWSEYKDIKEKYLELKGLSEGMKSFFVRSICDTVYSAWTSRDKFFYHSTSVSCVDFLSLTSQNCYVSTLKDVGQSRDAKVVDYGSLSVYSRHTIHWDKNERDPRTNGELKTIPDGELASVRLGNSSAGGEVEEIEYNFYVDTTSAILLLNYAVVLEDPTVGPHENDGKPRFTLKIRDGIKPLDVYGCGEADFLAGANTTEEDGWREFSTGRWKDWTTVGIDLRKYIGKSLKITLSTRDCGDKGHFGYAYFTLRCTDGKIQGLTCGADGEKTRFLAPDGFKYKWYSPMDPTRILSTEQLFEIEPNDTSTYYVDVIQTTNDLCFYTMDVSGMGRLPRANAAYSLDVKNCENIVRFENKSYIQRFNQVTNDSLSTNDKCEEFFWEFGDGDTTSIENPVHKYPDEGGTYTVKLKAKIAKGQCDDDTTFTITLPKLGTTIDTLNAVICQGEGYLFKGDTIFDSGCYVDSAKNIYGCDSIAIVNLFVAEKYDTTIYDTICSTDIYFFHGNQITETGIYTANLKSIYDCDSIVHLDVVVIETLILDVDSVIVACCDDECIVIPYELRSGLLDEYSFEFVGNALSIPSSDLSLETDAFVIKMPENLIPNRYECIIKFGERSCGKEEESVFVDLRYSKEVLVQRWGDVLAVRNSDYNGGYDFVSYQWYKNGEIIEGATSSILYEEGGLDLSAEYSVLLTRVSDNISAMTCVAELFDFSAIVDDIVVVFQSDNNVEIETQSAARLKIWSIQGVLVKEIELVGGHNLIANLDLEGVYLFEFILEDNSREIKQMIFN